MALYLAVVAGSWIAGRLPLRVAYAIAMAVGTAGYVFARGPRRAIQGNLSVILKLPPSSLRVRWTALRAFRNNAKNWIDMLRLGSVHPEEIERRVEVEGWENLDRAADEGLGVILVGLHLGNTDVVGQIVAARGHEMTVPVEPVRPESLFRRTQALRQSLGIRTVPAATSTRVLLSALKAGGVVGIMADRNITQTGLRLAFFGQPALISKGPAWLARRSGSPVLIGTGIRLPGGRFRGAIQRLSFQQTEDAAADYVANTRTMLRAAECRIRQHLDQWSMFISVWSEDVGGEDLGRRAASVGDALPNGTGC